MNGMKKLFTAFLLFILSVHQSNCCSSGRLLAATLPDKFPAYQYTAGIYTAVSDHHNLSVYKHSEFNVYIYYVPLHVRDAQAGGYWRIGDKAPEKHQDGVNDIMLALSTADSPEDIKEDWLVYDSSTSQWVAEPTFHLECVNKNVALCPSPNIVLSGLHERHYVHNDRMGLYRFTQQLFQSRPVFYHEETGDFLYFIDDMWLVGSEVGKKQGSMFVLDYAYDPEFITQTWVVFNKKYFTMDQGLKVSCENTTEVITDVMYEMPEEEGVPLVATGRRCKPSFCDNGGECFLQSDDTPACLCRTGYTGETCEKVVICADPPSVRHGRPLLPPGTTSDFPYQTIVKFACDAGYFLNGENAAICDSNGKWTNVPKCRLGNFHLTPVQVSTLVKPENETMPHRIGKRDTRRRSKSLHEIIYRSHQ